MKQDFARYLMNLNKKIVEPHISFPTPNAKLTLNVESLDGSETFLLDINRSGRISISRCTFQERYGVVDILVRLDLDKYKQPQNPDGTIFMGPHIHIYREGYGDRWACLLSDFEAYRFSSSDDLLTSFTEFCDYCNIKTIPAIQGVL